ncbi:MULTISPECIES: hypothetical protein [Lysinibacillus]|uniref:Group-specific protein n=1 Tax=Lysinibacillus capsici TaxID=2115968 RepID=A0ABY8KHZ3_9BACI|nr:hypothetical protein [Lysinibacillus capsici]WGF37759.1 hypothetical protein QBO96_18890 [Lysinibacillus capsici]
MNLRQRALTNFQGMKTSVFVKSTSKFKSISNLTLAKLIIISADDELGTNNEVEPTNYRNFSSQIVKTSNNYKDLPDRASALEQAISRVLKINTNIIRYSKVHLEHLVIWVSFLERYADNEQLLQKAKEILNVDLKISYTNFNLAITELKTLIKKHEESEAFNMITTNENVNVTLVSNESKDIEVNEGCPQNVNVALVSNEYLHETILLQTKELVGTYINLDELDELLPNFVFIKGDVVTLNAVYQDGDYETDIAMSFFLTSIDNDFDMVVALITDFDDELDEYDTLLHLISPTKLVKFVQDIFNEKDISFFEVENVTDLLKLVSIM